MEMGVCPMNQKETSNYLSQFRQDAVNLAVESDQFVAQTARDLGVNPNTLKIELVCHRDFNSRVEARAEIFEYIEVFYNRQRLHSTNGYEAPLVFEEIQKIA
jgi:transposase-like protein